jgi:hypothetical protein
MEQIAVALLVPIAATFLGVTYLLGDARESAWRLAMNLALAVGLGLGACPLLLFVWLRVLGVPGAAYPLIESSLALSLIATFATLLWHRRRTAEPGVALRPQARPALSRTQHVITTCFLIVVTVSAAALAYWALLMPHGGWDAWAVWNLRARFIFRAGESWPQAFEPFMQHTDYPLLVPLAVVRGWMYLDSEVQTIPAVIAVLFSVATVVLLVASVAERRGTTPGLLAGMMLLTTPIYLEQSAMQTADVPLAFFFLATVVLLTTFEHTGRLRALFLAGATAGLASWTKNEGLLFVIAALAAWLATALSRRRSRSDFKQALVLLAGAAPALLIGLWFKETLGPPNDLMNQQGAQMLAKLADPARYAQILRAALSDVWRHYAWLPVLAAGVLICGYDRRLLSRAAPIVLITMWLGYSTVYVVTPLDLAYHLDSSLERLLLQLWPIGLWIFFSGVRMPASWTAEVLPVDGGRETTRRRPGAGSPEATVASAQAPVS